MEFKVIINKFGFTFYSLILGFILTFISGSLINLYFSELLQNNLIVGLTLIEAPLILAISYCVIISYKHRQELVLTDEGLQSKTFGHLVWKEIKECSYESYKGISYIYVKLENNKKYSIFGLAKNPDNRNQIEEIYKGIKDRRYTSNAKGLFTPKEHHISNIKNIILFIFVVLGLIALISFSFH